MPLYVTGTPGAAGAGLDSIFISPAELASDIGSPTLSASVPQFRVFSGSASTRVSGQAVIPAGWATIAVDVIWSVEGNSGNIQWRLDYQNEVLGAAVGISYVNGSTVTVSPLTTNSLVKTELITALAATPGDFIIVSPIRIGASDTNTDNVFLYGVIVRKVT